MDINPLKPKNIPLAEETVLWFEFLLDPTLLSTHLKEKQFPDPSPLELISKFLSISESQNTCEVVPATVPATIPTATENNKIGRKQIALKILTLKIASHLKWNLDILEQNLNSQKQLQILIDLCSITSGNSINLPFQSTDCSLGPDGSQHALHFAMTLYHRWVVRTAVNKDLQNRIKPNYGFNMNVPEHADMLSENCIKSSIEFLNNECLNEETFRMLTMDSFVPLDINKLEITQNFEASHVISKCEQRTQIHYDLCTYYLYNSIYDQARKHALACQVNLIKLKEEYGPRTFLFCCVTEEDLTAYLLACGLQDNQNNLLQQMNDHFILNDYSSLIRVLQEDNLQKEIPLAHRRNLELDIRAGSITIVNNTIDLQITALNTIRNIFEDKDAIINSALTLKTKENKKSFTILNQEISKFLTVCCLADRSKIIQYFLNILLTTNNFNEIIVEIKLLNLFSELELNQIKTQRCDMSSSLSPIAMQTEWELCPSKDLDLRLEKGAYERQLNSCSNANGIRICLVKLAAIKRTDPLWKINPSWVLSVPLKSIVMSSQRGFLQDFSYILLGKAKEMGAKNNFIGALNILNTLKSEVEQADIVKMSSITKLNKFIVWEIVLIQICQCLEEWPKKTDLTGLSNKCKKCLTSVQNGENVIPRSEIIDYCTSMLLNLNEWNSVIIPDKRFPSIEFSSSFASIVIDIEKNKGNKKIFRDAWDLILPLFVFTYPKRGNNMSYDGASALTSNLNPWLKRLRDPMIISIVISLLAKIHNILKDDPNVDLNAEYIFLWPTTITNTNSYNIKLVSETLNNLLNQSLKYYPNNLPWIKLKADLEFVNGNHESAMKYYVNVLITGSDYCTLNLQKPLVDDYIIRRMIKCSSNLGCYMQATVLCQFLDEIDYSLAFKNISEKTSNFSDAMDLYYACIWDSTLLEFIVNLHSKKGEYSRKLQAISYIGQLELNANDNEEIKREAASIRKSYFMRALAKQYLI